MIKNNSVSKRNTKMFLEYKTEKKLISVLNIFILNFTDKTKYECN